MKKYVALFLSAFFALEGVSVCFSMEEAPQENIKIAHKKALKRRSDEMNEEFLGDLRAHPEKRIVLDFSQPSSLEGRPSKLLSRLSRMSSARILQKSSVGSDTENAEKSLGKLDISEK